MMSSDQKTCTMVENFNELSEEAQLSLIDSMVTAMESDCVRINATLTVMESDVAKNQEKLERQDRECERIQKECEEIRAGHTEIRAEHAEIRASFQKLHEQIDLELKYSEEDLKFYKNLNSRLDACFKA